MYLSAHLKITIINPSQVNIVNIFYEKLLNWPQIEKNSLAYISANLSKLLKTVKLSHFILMAVC
jgi:hypothetical protein